MTVIVITVVHMIKIKLITMMMKVMMMIMTKINT